MSIATLEPSHSLQEVIFSLQLKENMSEQAVSRLASLKDVLKDDLPIFEEVRDMTIEMKGGQIITQSPTNVLVGVTFSHLQENGTPDWRVRAERDYIRVSCMEYKNWGKTWAIARKYLETIVEQVVDDVHPIKTVSLQYVNLFQYGDSKSYKWSEIFRADSPYLTEKIKNSGVLWHLFQGWVENDAILKSGCLNNLNLAASIKIKEQLTTVSLLRQAQRENQKLGDIDRVVNQLHVDIKRILLDVLEPKLAERIGLANEERS